MTAAKCDGQQQPALPKPVSDDAILKVAKEVAVKFIEVGRLTPQNFDEVFRAIHETISKAVRS